MIINIRGTNGSGKSTLAASFIKDDAETVTLVTYPKPTKRKPDNTKDVVGYLSNWKDLGTVCVVGPYDGPIGGLDRIANFALQREAIRAATKIADTVICEGVLASTVFSSWADFFEEMGDVAILYLDTQLETCYERIRQRQIKATGEEKAIKTEQVAQKVKMIESTRRRFDERGLRTHLISGNDGGTFVEQIIKDSLSKGSV